MIREASYTSVWDGGHAVTSPCMDIPKSVLSSKEELLEFLKTHKYKSCPSAIDIMRSGKSLVFIFLDWEAYGDRSYYYCEEDDTVYSDYFSIGD